MPAGVEDRERAVNLSQVLNPDKHPYISANKSVFETSEFR